MGCRKSSAAQTFQRRIVNLAIIVGIKNLHSPTCTGETEELWNLEQLRYCQCYRKISLLPAFKPTTQKKFEIHNLNSGSLHNGNNVLPFGSPQSTPYFKKIDIVSHRLAERLHNLGEKDHPQIPIMLLFTEGTSVNSICKSQLVPKSVNLAVTTFRSTYLTWLCRLS